MNFTGLNIMQELIGIYAKIFSMDSDIVQGMRMVMYSILELSMTSANAGQYL